MKKQQEQQEKIRSLSDPEVPEKFRSVVPAWRKLAAELGYTGPVAWNIREGFTLKEHAPKAGPCFKSFDYLQDWNLKNDEPTKKSLVFWIPRLLAGSTDKNKDEQLALLAETRKRLELPEHHLASFGSAALLAALILVQFKRTGERVPLDYLWTRTDTLHADAVRLRLGYFDGCGLDCGSWAWDEDRDSDLGCFALGVEILGALTRKPTILKDQGLMARVEKLESDMGKIRKFLVLD